MQPSATRQRILEVLLAHPDGLRVMPLAKAVELKHPTLLRHLEKMHAAGAVERSDGPGRQTRYCARDHLQVAWVSAEHRLLDAWSSTSPVDWRFPLVSRIPDLGAQAFLLEWFDRAQAKGLLPEHRSLFEKMTARPPTLHILVYGSCARGEAHSKSDVDVLLHTDRPWAGAERLIDLAYAISTDHERPISIQHLAEADMQDLPPEFRDNLCAEGKTIWCNDPRAPPLERTLEPGGDG